MNVLFNIRDLDVFNPQECENQIQCKQLVLTASTRALEPFMVSIYGRRGWIRSSREQHGAAFVKTAKENNNLLSDLVVNLSNTPAATHRRPPI